MMRRILALVLVFLPSLALAFSDNELRAIYTQMKAGGAIKCGMTIDHLIEKYRGCAENSVLCDASLVVVGEKGQCVDSLQFQGLRGPDAVIIFNGQRYPKPIPVVPGKPKMEVSS